MAPNAWALLLIVILAGCTAPDAGGTREDEPAVVTDPGDYGYLNATNGSRPHVHDYWDGAYSWTLHEGSFNSGDKDRYKVPMGEGDIIRPGTRWINVTISWQVESGSHPMTWPDGYLEYRMPGEGITHRVDVDNDVTHTINTTEATNDAPHSVYSRWDFTVAASGDQQEQRYGIAPADFQVNVTIARPPGSLPFAPPHPDFWGDNETLVLFDTAGPMDYTGDWNTARDMGQDTPIQELRPTPLVPPQTQRLEVKLHYNSSTEERLHARPDLQYSGPGVYEFRAPADEMRIQKKDGLLRWVIETPSSSWDSPYVNESHWTLRLIWSWDSSPENPPIHDMEGDYHVRLQAFRAA